MTLYELLDCLQSNQFVIICEINDYDQCFLRFANLKFDAQRSTDVVWPLLMNRVESIQTVDNSLLIFVQMDNYNTFIGSEDPMYKNVKNSIVIKQEFMNIGRGESTT